MMSFHADEQPTNFLIAFLQTHINNHAGHGCRVRWEGASLQTALLNPRRLFNFPVHMQLTVGSCGLLRVALPPRKNCRLSFSKSFIVAYVYKLNCREGAATDLHPDVPAAVQHTHPINDITTPRSPRTIATPNHHHHHRHFNNRPRTQPPPPSSSLQ
jgi:hypothetical protein